MAKYDFLIIGAGLFGSTFAHQAALRGQKCLVIDRREHVGGNLYCEKREGINVHTYGPHIFHTSDREVWDYVNSITPFNRFTNSPLALAPDGKLYNLPFNMNTFAQMWGVHTPTEAQVILEKQRAEAMAKMRADGAEEPRNLEEQALILVGRDIYGQLVKGYTEKQWGRKCTDLPAFIIRRLPVRLTFDNNYFNDDFQGIPAEGFNSLIERMLADADIALSTDFFDRRDHWIRQADKVVFTGKIDRYFDYRFGKLEYRSVRFETTVEETPNFQGNAVVNYTDSAVPFTRIIEHKHFETFGNAVFDNPRTVITREYSSEWKEGMEPFYPVNDEKNQLLYLKYKELADKEQNVIFGGRLAEYRYYDMAPIIANVLKLFR